MGVFVLLPLVLPLTAWPVARLAEQRLHPRAATWLLTVTACALALCSTLCLTLLMVVGTAQLPGNPLPDAWSDDEVREAVPYDEVAGQAAIPALLAVLAGCSRVLWRHVRVRRRAERSLVGLPRRTVAVLPDPEPYAYALPGRDGGRVVVSAGLLNRLAARERRALFAHERAHLAGAHHRFLLLVQLAARANPFLRPLRTAVSYTVERWADEEAAGLVRSRQTVARAIGKAALVSRPHPVLAGFAAPGPVPRRVAALLGPAPAVHVWPSLFTAVGVAAWTAAAGTMISALSSANSAVTLFLVLKAATPL
ncbi:M48 family metalloprotease [Streptomyces sp. SID2999]|uniref:M56 family metallopeptidase n=1 Tax=Streptomyces sp. SID2999 TaxID=2690258 RepID=UPI00137165D8|nr:M56 family metallopeptidase [Streptomyces sp. SID2999]MYZ05849.1 M48 family metalloprotease [Streptomyces sp. SID2999]